ncbi:MAG: hypothetical protein JRH20_16485 [Deltaproteobacteria bacterium]|nr:hypothetical protein [Deltaproteobacteria bacterium]
MKRSWVHGLGAMVLAGSLGLVACTVVVTQDVTVEWTIERSDAPSLCSTYGIDTFTVTLLGPEHQSTTVSCEDEYWFVDFLGVEEGIYEITVAAWDVDNVQVGSLTGEHFIDGRVITFNFLNSDLTGSTSCGDGFCDSDETCSSCPADCGSCGGDAKIDVLWNINGTVDGTETGQSWDSCTEVGATHAVVSVDGEAQSVDCNVGGNMSTVLSGLIDDQSYALKIKLVDANGADLTTEVAANVLASVAGGQFIGDFFYDSFHEPNMTGIEGQYHFKTTYDSLQCSQTTPIVDYQVTLIRTEDNTAVTNVQVCDLGNTGCFEADAVAAKPCTDLEQVLSVLPWGSYKIKLEGGIGTPTNLDICWEHEGNILIGAGTDNPMDQIDLAGITGASCFL